MSTPVDPDDPSNGYEAVAAAFIAARERSPIGAETIRVWSRRSLPRAATVLDLGCGSGVPVAETLIAAGLTVYGVDASPTLVEAFRARFPEASVICEPAERSALFGRVFDAAVAVGLLFLLPADRQRPLVRRVAAVLTPGGRFLFTAPVEAGTWADALTGRQSVSLGREAYQRIIAEAGLTLVAEHHDEGGNHYYDTVRSGGVSG